MKVSNKQEFYPDKLFQTSLMFVGKSKSLPKSGAHEKYFTQLESSLTHKH
jgi:hypothetical protein